MLETELRNVMQAWFAEWEPRWKEIPVWSKLILSDRRELNKAGAHLKAQGHLCSITVWGRGTLEFIILDTSTSRETVIDEEFESADDLRSKLNDFSRQFLRSVTPAGR